MWVRKLKILSSSAGARCAGWELEYLVPFQALLSSLGQLLVAFFTTAASECCARGVQQI